METGRPNRRFDKMIARINVKTEIWRNRHKLGGRGEKREREL